MIMEKGWAYFLQRRKAKVFRRVACIIFIGFFLSVVPPVNPYRRSEQNRSDGSFEQYETLLEKLKELEQSIFALRSEVDI